MASSLDRAAYATEFDIFERALISERGIQVVKMTQGEANKLRERLNKARALDRELNRRMYRDDPDHPMYGRSEYAGIIVRIIFDEERAKWLCRLEKASIEEMDIEDIPPLNGVEEEEEEEDGIEGTD